MIVASRSKNPRETASIRTTADLTLWLQHISSTTFDLNDTCPETILWISARLNDGYPYHEDNSVELIDSHSWRISDNYYEGLAYGDNAFDVLNKIITVWSTSELLAAFLETETR